MQSSLQMAGLCSTQRKDLGSLEVEHWCVQRAGHGAQGLGAVLIPSGCSEGKDLGLAGRESGKFVSLLM